MPNKPQHNLPNTPAQRGDKLPQQPKTPAYTTSKTSAGQVGHVPLPKKPGKK